MTEKLLRNSLSSFEPTDQMKPLNYLLLAFRGVVHMVFLLALNIERAHEVLGSGFSSPTKSFIGFIWYHTCPESMKRCQAHCLVAASYCIDQIRIQIAFARFRRIWRRCASEQGLNNTVLILYVLGLLVIVCTTLRARREPNALEIHGKG